MEDKKLDPIVIHLTLNMKSMSIRPTHSFVLLLPIDTQSTTSFSTPEPTASKFTALAPPNLAPKTLGFNEGILSFKISSHPRSLSLYQSTAGADPEQRPNSGNITRMEKMSKAVKGGAYDQKYRKLLGGCTQYLISPVDNDDSNHLQNFSHSFQRDSVQQMIADTHIMELVFRAADSPGLNMPLLTIGQAYVDHSTPLFIVNVTGEWGYYAVKKSTPKDEALKSSAERDQIKPVLLNSLWYLPIDGNKKPYEMKVYPKLNGQSSESGLVTNTANYLRRVLDLTMSGFGVVREEGTQYHFTIDLCKKMKEGKNVMQKHQVRKYQVPIGAFENEYVEEPVSVSEIELVQKGPVVKENREVENTVQQVEVVTYLLHVVSLLFSSCKLNGESTLDDRDFYDDKNGNSIDEVPSDEESHGEANVGIIGIKIGELEEKDLATRVLGLLVLTIKTVNVPLTTHASYAHEKTLAAAEEVAEMVLFTAKQEDVLAIDHGNAEYTIKRTKDGLKLEETEGEHSKQEFLKKSEEFSVSLLGLMVLHLYYRLLWVYLSFLSLHLNKSNGGTCSSLHLEDKVKVWAAGIDKPGLYWFIVGG